MPSAIDAARIDGVLRAVAEGREDAYLSAGTAQSHAAMLERLPDGSLGMVWFGGTQEGVSDISVWFSRFDEVDHCWSAAQRLSDDPDRSEQNPVLFTTPAGELWLLFTAQHAGDQDTAHVRRRRSSDSGRSWSDVETLFPADDVGGIFVRQPIVVTPSGRWILPIFHCVRVPGQRWTGEVDTSAVMISDDAGAHWREVVVSESTGLVHMSVVLIDDGSLHALFRSRWADAIYESRSLDEGETWSLPEPTALPNNNSSIQHRMSPGGRIALVYNHSSRDDATERRASLYDEIDDTAALRHEAPAEPSSLGRAFWGAPRAPLTLALSDDSGRSWWVLDDLDQGDGYCLTNDSLHGRNREFSYPTVLPSPDGGWDVAYTYHRQAIKHVRLSSEWVDARP
ncbi:sialidase family protein [Microbacterium sp. RG1]|uniref:sialidase family protein n=1 Tax=Microbacterium sp. RG1 TaxID=2489212 RepID=UPI001EE39AE8|nr:exo-alpha-sialidase [Microbacterium sp. RG1]